MPFLSLLGLPLSRRIADFILFSSISLIFRKPKFTYLSRLSRRFSLGSLRVLDIGVANNSKDEWLKVFTNTVQYDGLDWHEPLGFTSTQCVCASTFYCINLNREMPSAAIVGSYNIILASHVLEHLEKPYDVLCDLLNLLESGGVAYLEFPNHSSLRRSLISTYDFYGDSTHEQPLDAHFVIEKVRSLGIYVCEYGRCLTVGKVVFSSLLALSRLIRARRGWRDSLLYVAGMVDYCVLRKR